MKIKYKFLCGLLTISIVILIMLNVAFYKLMEENNKKIVLKEMENLYYLSKEYIKNDFLFSDEHYFEEDSSKLCKDISNMNDCKVTIYDKNNHVINTAYGGNTFKIINDSEFKSKKMKQIDLAKKDKSSFKINKIQGDTVATVAFPIYKNENILGIITFDKYYTHIYNSSEKIFKSLKLIIILGFIVLDTFTYILSISITKPIIKLNKVAKEIANGNYNENIEIKSKDEIGELSNQISIMKNKISNQIEHINEIAKYRKNFFDNVTHELKTPLTIIKGYSEILINEEVDNDFNKISLNHIKDESERLHNMVIELLEVSKEDILNESKLDMKKVNISNLIEDICYHMSFKANKYNMDINEELEDDIFIWGDENKLKQVLINILDNAIKYGRENEVIYIKESVKENKVNINVINKTTDYKEKEKGSLGIGINLSKVITKLHYGNLDFYNENGVNKVNIEFPCI